MLKVQPVFLQGTLPKSLILGSAVLLKGATPDTPWGLLHSLLLKNFWTRGQLSIATSMHLESSVRIFTLGHNH